MNKTDLILLTKLEPPQIKGRILRRERLLNNLKDNLNKKLILICADAGYGKTTLLSQFCEEFDKPYVFYDLDAKDNDIAVFFNYLIAGIEKYSTHFGKRVKDIIRQTRQTETVVGTFINEFVEKIKKDFYIILDDYHHLQKSRKIANIIDYFLRHLPPNLHFIISSRSTPSINLSYYLAKQELFKLEKEHLQFDTKEIHVLLKDVYGLQIPEAEMTRIAELSEGWVTVLQLILQKMCSSGEEKTRETLNGYTSSDEDVFDYFAREVFKNQSKAIREFLMKTSILEYLNPSICNHILHIRRSKKMISYLMTEHMFIAKAGNNFIYQPLFQEFLQKRLANSLPRRQIRILHSKTGNYFFVKKDYSLAVHHLLHAERYAKAAKIMKKHYRSWEKPGQFSAYIQLIETFPDSILEKYPCLLLTKARALFELYKTELALKVIESAIKKFRKLNDLKGSAEALALKGHGLFILVQPREGLYFIKKAYKLTGRRDTLEKTHMLLRMAEVYRIMGKFTKTKTILEEALKITHKFKNTGLEFMALHSLAMLYYSMSHFKQADNLFQEILSKFRSQISDMNLAYMYRSVASIAIDVDDKAKALDYLSRAENIVQRYSKCYLKNYLLYLKGRLHLFQGNYHNAIELFKEAVELNKEIEVKISDINPLIDMIDGYTKIDNVSAARDALKKTEPLLMGVKDIPEDFIPYQTVKGKLETAEGNFPAALDSLNLALRNAKKIHDPYRVMGIYYALGKHYFIREMIQEALEYFRKCLVIAKKHDFNAYLTIQGRQDLKLFEIALDKNIMSDYLSQILRKINTEEAKEIVGRIRVNKGIYDFECSFFGTLEIKDFKGRVIKPNWRTNKTKTLFIILSINHPKGCARDQLINTFWPNKGMREAAHSLQVEISSLRKLLMEILKSDFEAKSVILYKNQNYYLNPRFYIKTDVQEFEELIKEAAAKESTDKSESIQLYNKALEIYHGDFCEDITDDWCGNMKIHYKETMLRILKKLGQIYYDSNNYVKALDFYQRALEFNEYDEETHLALMRCFAALKDKNGVQRQYRVLMRNLQKIGLSNPSSEAIDIYKECLK